MNFRSSMLLAYLGVAVAIVAHWALLYITRIIGTEKAYGGWSDSGMHCIAVAIGILVSRRLIWQKDRSPEVLMCVLLAYGVMLLVSVYVTGAFFVFSVFDLWL